MNVKLPHYPKYKDSGVEWLGEVPEHWELQPLFAIANERSESNRGMLEDNLLSLSYGRIIQKDIDSNDGLLPESFETYQIVHPGDIVFRLTDLQNDKRSLRTAIVEQQGIITSAYLALAPEKVRPQFINYLLRAYDVTKVFYSMGGGLRQSLKFSDVRRLPILVPHREEQRRIASFLDYETGKIDALVDKQARLIELLKEKRQVVISHAVTKGLNPGAPMTESGVEWLGKVPACWEVPGFTKYLSSVVDYRGRTPTKVDDGAFLVTAKNIRNGAIDYDASQEYIEAKEYEKVMKRGRPEIGDVLFTTEAPLGQVAIVDRTDIALAQRIIKFRGNPERLTNQFLRYWIMGNACQFNLGQLATGSTALGIKGSKIGQLRICLPQLDEQLAITAMLDRETAKLDLLVEEATHAIGLLNERRSALMSAAVTGKIDVRNFHPQEASTVCQ